MEHGAAGSRFVLVAGAEQDEHVDAVRRAVAARGVRVVHFDALAFPARHRLALGDRAETMTLDGETIARPAAVYLRSLYLSPMSYLVDVDEEMRENWRRTMIVFREKAELLASLLRRWELLGVPLYNSYSASDATRKPYQIAQLEAAGLPVPATLWTNDPDSVRRFASGRRVVFKPVAGGAATRELKLDEIDEERFARLANAPVTFQELLPGTNIRVFVIDGHVAAAFRIEADELDYRQNEQAIVAFEPDEELAAICRRATEVLGLRFTGMDLKEDADGRPRILELNPSPMFLGFDQRAGTDVLGALADALASHARP
ncbi:MAG: ATP-grasp domain-containing protein [Acidobacteria bacterium]|nr:MAG: ATP-grasp domain-containing protein [Acidobacteriota bacterium]